VLSDDLLTADISSAIHTDSRRLSDVQRATVECGPPVLSRIFAAVAGHTDGQFLQADCVATGRGRSRFPYNRRTVYSVRLQLTHDPTGEATPIIDY